jgi:hypothetical protein
MIAAGLAILAAGIAVPAAAQTVGTMTAERATVARDGGRVRAGDPIALGDRLQSDASGEGIIVFEDESSARLGPNADLTIDSFVYDPQRRNGAVRLLQRGGTARIFGGQISKRGRSEVRTPHIVLGLRGGIADVTVGAGGSSGTLITGTMTCEAGGERRTVTNPGFSCVSDGSGVQTVRLGGGEGQFVDPAGGQGGSGSRTTSNHCASEAGMGSPACTTRDGQLPGPQTGFGTSSAGGVPGGAPPPPPPPPPEPAPPPPAPPQPPAPPTPTPPPPAPPAPTPLPQTPPAPPPPPLPPPPSPPPPPTTITDPAADCVAAGGFFDTQTGICGP